MNGHMTERAGLILLRLVMKRRGCRWTRAGGKRMTLQAEQIHLCAFEQSRIRGPVRRVAGNTPLHLHDFVFVNERPLLISVALVARLVLSRSGAQLTRQKTSVRI